ncbi:MAG: hypothetical protein PHV20_12495 [Bacteroidales bacterium]|nr:hypothetical protein [Bacteroidales bacterium]
MFNGKKVKEELDNYPGTKLDFYKKSGLSKSTIISMISTQNPQAENIEKLADFTMQTIDYFFERDIELNSKKSETNSKSNKELIDEVKRLTKKTTIQEIEIERLTLELNNSKLHKAD